MRRLTKAKALRFRRFLLRNPQVRQELLQAATGAMTTMFDVAYRKAGKGLPRKRAYVFFVAGVAACRHYEEHPPKVITALARRFSRDLTTDRR